jgi:hypothetical protein
VGEALGVPSFLGKQIEEEKAFLFDLGIRGWVQPVQNRVNTLVCNNSSDNLRKCKILSNSQALHPT